MHASPYIKSHLNYQLLPAQYSNRWHNIYMTKGYILPSAYDDQMSKLILRAVAIEGAVTWYMQCCIGISAIY